MTSFEFWNEWKNKSRIEEIAIKHAKIAKRLILQNIPKEEIVSIYIKGSMARREMNDKSDVDTLTIVKHSRYLKKLIKLHSTYGKKYEINIDFTGYSLWELKNNKKSLQGKNDRPSPARTMHHIRTYRVIYGKALNETKYDISDSRKRLNEMIKVFEEKFIPSYEKKNFSFSDIVKQTFWLVENEQSVLGKKSFNSWKDMKKAIKTKNHIIHEAYALRQNPTKDLIQKRIFITKLRQYIRELKRL